MICVYCMFSLKEYYTQMTIWTSLPLHAVDLSSVNILKNNLASYFGIIKNCNITLNVILPEPETEL